MNRLKKTKTRKIHVESVSPDPTQTKIVDLESGEIIQGIVRAEIIIDAQHIRRELILYINDFSLRGEFEQTIIEAE